VSADPRSDGSLPFGFNSDPSVHRSVAPGTRHGSTTRCGVWLFPAAFLSSSDGRVMQPPDTLLNVIERLDAAGLDEVWLGDEGVYGWDPFIMAALALGRTSRVRIGIGVANPVTRHASALAASAATLHVGWPGRIMLGLGTGGSMPLGPIGMRAARVAEFTEALQTARGVLAGRAEGSYRPPHGPIISAPQVPIYVGARGPRLNAVASRFADGVLLSGVAIADLDEVISSAHVERPVQLTLLPVVSADALAGALTPEELRPALVALQSRYPDATIGASLVGDDISALLDRCLDSLILP
jgi:alkanesulfonate monooxygenase SsuD/methylene tetrahydromethanopterin reductase-like flavin-dependent oxidoreductase (luciferase family)